MIMILTALLVSNLAILTHTSLIGAFLSSRPRQRSRRKLRPELLCAL